MRFFQKGPNIMKERIKDLCRKNGISMNKLEDTLGFGKGYISKLGVTTPNTSKIKAIADYFGVSVDYLMTGEEKEGGEKYYLNDETAKVAQEIFNNKELRALFSVTKDADPEDLRALHSMALALKRKERGYDDDTGY